MKNVLTILLLFVFSITLSFAQNEEKSVGPTFRVTVEREVLYATIEKKGCIDVTVELKAAAFNDLFVSGVKVVVIDNRTGRKIYKKRFPQSYLYAFSDGTIQVGKGKALTQIVLFKLKDGGGWSMTLKEKGIY